MWDESWRKADINTYILGGGHNKEEEESGKQKPRQVGKL